MTPHYPRDLYQAGVLYLVQTTGTEDKTVKISVDSLESEAPSPLEEAHQQAVQQLLDKAKLSWPQIEQRAEAGEDGREEKEEDEEKVKETQTRTEQYRLMEIADPALVSELTLACDVAEEVGFRPPH